MGDLHGLPGKWLPISMAPPETDLEVGVMDKSDVVVALVFPVRKKGIDWVHAATRKLVDIAPTHWRKWTVDH
jgi:hypothetical protein